jgi:hypothetical protein
MGQRLPFALFYQIFAEYARDKQNNYQILPASGVIFPWKNHGFMKKALAFQKSAWIFSFA